MPGASAATPVIWGDRVFATAADPKTKKQSALCLDRRTGAQLWRAEISEFTTDGQYSNSCSPSPVTDGKLVVFFFGTGDLVAFDVAGKKLWERNIGPFAFQWTFSASPLLHEGRLIMQVLQRDVAVRGNGQPTGNESFLLAIDPATGKDLWPSALPCPSCTRAAPNSSSSEATPSAATNPPPAANSGAGARGTRRASATGASSPPPLSAAASSSPAAPKTRRFTP
jgi:outer membrane protein assembly factor BamB